MANFYSRPALTPRNPRPPTRVLATQLEEVYTTAAGAEDDYSDKLDFSDICIPHRERTGTYQPNESLSGFSPSNSHCCTPMPRSELKRNNLSSDFYVNGNYQVAYSSK